MRASSKKHRVNFFGVFLGIVCASLFVASFAVAADAPKNILLILPHPDDETMIRSVITRMVEAGNSVSAIYLTQGEGGRDRHWGDEEFTGDLQKKKSAELAKTRVGELETAGRGYGYKNLYELKMPDDPLRDPKTHVPTRDATRFLKDKGPWDVNEIKNKIETIANQEKPDLVITFFPGQPGTHAHHQATSMLVDQQYLDGRLGPNVQGVFGFYEEKEASGAATTLPKAEERIEFSPKLISKKDGPNFGKAYGETGTKSALAYDSQLKGQTETFLRNWDQNPSEVLTVMHSKRGLSPLIEAMGTVQGMKVFPVGAECSLDLKKITP